MLTINSITIVIIDDHPIVREGFKRMLANESATVVGGEANSGREAVAQLPARRWDVVVSTESL